MPEMPSVASSTIAELGALPLSAELLAYYRARLESSEAEMRIVMQFFAAHLELRSMALEAHARDGELLPVRMGADGDLELLDGATSSLRL